MATYSPESIPKVCGRHRNTALAQARRNRAACLVLAGRTYQEVADELGYANRGTVYRLVRTALDDTRPEDVLEASILADRRIEDLLGAWWHDAVSGNIPAAQLVLRIIDLQIRLFRLHISPETASSPSPSIPLISPADLVTAAKTTSPGEVGPDDDLFPARR